MRVFWDTAGLLTAISDLSVEGPLPARVVLVPRERVAHALRRELLRAGRSDLLAGTRLIGPATAALEVLRSAGFDPKPGEEALRPLRLRALFASELNLSCFDPELLRTARGWDRAIASSLNDLEAAGLSPDELPEDGIGPDLAYFWHTLERQAGESVTLGRVFAEAAERLEQGARWPFEGPVLAPVTGFESAMQARFVRSIPRCELSILGALPRRLAHLERIDALFGETARRTVERSVPPRATQTERDRLAAYLFEDPSALADVQWPSHSGRDGTVELEEHSGVDAEIDAAVDWLAREVLEMGTPLEQIAVLVPRLDPWATLLTARLTDLGWPSEARAVFVAGGLPATGAAGGARVQTVLRALRRYLDQAGLAEVLTLLRPSGEGARRFSRAEAVDLVTCLGCLGGSAADPEGALRWLERLADRRRAWAERVQAAEELGSDQERLTRSAGRYARRLDRLESVRQALEALLEVGRQVVAEATLETLWPAMRKLLSDWVVLPGDGVAIPSRLDAVMAPLCQSDAGRALRGEEALRVVEDALRATRLPLGRFGEPAVYVGAVEGAVGIPFTAVRVLGLAEGSLPASAREDPVLSDVDRRRLAPSLLPTTELRVARQLQALYHVVRSAGQRVVLSAPRLGLERSQREPSGVFIEAGAALGRPSGLSGVTGGASGRVPVPNSATLSRAYFRPARGERSTFVERAPLTERHWQDQVALGPGRGPSRWAGRPEVDLDRLRQLRDSIGGPADGMIGPCLPDTRVPGLTSERAVSASGLRDLLACPHRFLLARLLYYGEPAGFPNRGELEPMAYGSLFHGVAERFAREHGPAFGDREGTLEDWYPVGRRLADAELDAFLEEHPLEPGMVRDQQRDRLLRDVDQFLKHEWNDGAPREFVDAERAFGFETPLAVETVDGPIHLRGYIDRLDQEAGRTLVRDLKTGKCKPREGKRRSPRTDPDLQLGIYGLVTRQMAGEWGLSDAVSAAYVHPVTPDTPERTFSADFGDLAASAHEWLRIARGLLTEGQYGHTPDSRDCQWCPFGGVCEPEAHSRAHTIVQAHGGPLAALAKLKQEER